MLAHGAAVWDRCGDRPHHATVIVDARGETVDGVGRDTSDRLQISRNTICVPAHSMPLVVTPGLVETRTHPPRYDPRVVDRERPRWADKPAEHAELRRRSGRI